MKHRMIDNELSKKDPLSKTVYTREEAEIASLAYFNGDELAANVWINKYALKDSSGNLYESNPEMMHHRIASELARIENNYKNPLSEDYIFSLLDKFKYIIPQGSPMSGIGNDFQTVSLSNCFVIGVNGPSDSYGAIMKTDQEQVQLMKRRGGVGHDLSDIRPSGSTVNNSALTSTGIVPFMERYSNSTSEVAQGGRRGALMLSCSVRHPEIEAFVNAKLDSTKVTGANISIKIHDDFMNAVKSGTQYTQKYPIWSETPSITQQIDPKFLWDKIIHNAWKSAEPGILYWDQIIRESFADRYADLGYRTVSTNPCGELPLCPDDSCRLLAVNLLSYVVNPFTKDAYFDFNLFKEHAQVALRLMDDIIDLEIEKISSIISKIQSDPESDEVKRTELELWQRIQAKCKDGRRTGAGITAEGDMLAALNLRYGTPEATEFAVKVHKTYALEVFRSSNILARERGAFKIWDPTREEGHPFLARIKQCDESLYEDLMKYGRRNIALLTIAPTGTVSLMSQTTSGIEPAFMVSYKRRKKINPNDKNSKTDFIDSVGDHWEEYHVFHHGFKKWIMAKGHKFIPAGEPVHLDKLSDSTIEMLIEKSPYYKAMANDVDWVEKVRMQGKIQQWVDHSISVTVNLPEHVTEELVNQVYMTAWEEGCKGCTIYRDGSRSGVLVSKDEKKKNELFKDSQAPKRPIELECSVTKFMNSGERWVGFIGLLNGKPYEIFTGNHENFPIPNYVDTAKIVRSKKDGQSSYDVVYTDKLGESIKIPNLNHAFDAKYHDMAKTISAVLRHGMPLPYVIELLDSLNLDGDLITTWKAGVKRMLKKFVKDGTTISGKTCKTCGSDSLVYTEGCLTCKNCGDSKCG
jgi:ribonucleoside-diphosphate reductase alpha chain